MTKRSVIRRDEMFAATLDLGGTPIQLADYATTGLLAVAVGPRGSGKTNCALVAAEQLSLQGWVVVLTDPEGELETLYGDAVKDAGELARLLETRERSIVVVAAAEAEAFVPYGQAILEAADRYRKPLLVVIDETQLFSAVKKRKGAVGAASDILNDFAERGRKRALDLFVTAHRFTGTLNRSIFANKNLLLVGTQEDPTAWSALAPQFRAARIDFGDLNALAPGEFYAFSRRGVEKVRVPMSKALAKVAVKARPARRVLPATYAAWDRAMRRIPTARLQALTDPVVALLGAVAGLTSEQLLAGRRALADELGAR